MVELLLPKQVTGVRFPSPAPFSHMTTGAPTHHGFIILSGGPTFSDRARQRRGGEPLAIETAASTDKSALSRGPCLC